jgi:8-oxo-dGTP pyrophosphatase MutT (NUDIX family)
MSIGEFEQFAVRLRERLQGPLPGAAAHEPLRATPTGLVKPNFQHQLPPKPGSVLILLYPGQHQIMFPLIKRPEYLGAHSGQVSLPGGKAEPGEELSDTALREAREEIGVDRASVEIIGRLSDFFVIPSNFLVSPFVAVARQPLVLAPDPVEVERILHGSLDALMAEDAVQVRDIVAARVFPMRAPHFEIEGEVVWGATAMMLNELRLVTREVR